MEIEYSFEVKGAAVYRFTGWEENQIAEGLKPIIQKLEKKIEKVINHPKNEGQVTYKEQIRELRQEIKSLEEIINVFTEK